MATVEKIRRDIEKTKEKISEQQKRLRTLEAQLTEEVSSIAYRPRFHAKAECGLKFHTPLNRI